MAHEEMLDQAIAGDQAALAQLVRLYHDRVHRFGVRACLNRFDADDAVQQAFIALSRRPDVQQHRSVLSWLLTTVKHACLRLMRPFARERRSLGERVELSATSVSDASPSAEEALERYALVRAVHVAIANIPKEQREVLILRDIEGKSGEEVCAMLHISLPSMKSRLHRARDLVRAELEPFRKA